jgi:endonuclease/exonuclease/phosphatase (EEP) superfamily protein YafD
MPHPLAMRRLALLALAVIAGPLRSSKIAAATPAPAHAFRLMSYNLQFNNPDPAATLAAIAASDPDVAIFQEVTPAWRDILIAHLAERYPHRAFRIHWRSAGLAVLSKLPLTSEEELAAVDWFPAQRFTIVAEFGPVQILNVHLRPAIEHGSWLRGYLSTPPIRRREIEVYYEALARHPVPTIVAGDFNEEPAGSALAFLVGQGFTRARTTGPRTWHYERIAMGRPVDVLQLDIDHVMVDGRIVARDPHVVNCGGSDHRPVVVTIEPAAA